MKCNDGFDTFAHHHFLDNHMSIYDLSDSLPDHRLDVHVMSTVVNKYKVNMTDPDIVYIGRGSIWGNPFPMKDKTDDERSRVIAAYRKWLWFQQMQGSITKEMLLELDGKRLACYCSPQACHGDIIVKAIKWAKGEIV